MSIREENIRYAEQLSKAKMLDLDTLAFVINKSRIDHVMEMTTGQEIETYLNFMIHLTKSEDTRYMYDVVVDRTMWDFPDKSRFVFVCIENDAISYKCELDTQTRNELFEFSKKDIKLVNCLDLHIERLKAVDTDRHHGYQLYEDIGIGKYGHGGSIVIATKEHCDSFFNSCK